MSMTGLTTGVPKVMVCVVSVPKIAIMSETGGLFTAGAAVKVETGWK
jgi:hypothetical protein